MNGITRKKLYPIIASRDGEYCRCCGALPYERQLVIDHKDNNNSNNDLNNLQLLCRTCNYQKNPARPLDLCVREDEDETELQKSRRLRPQVRQFVFHEVSERTEVPEKELLDGGAEEFACSQETIKRIVASMCSFRGILERDTRSSIAMIRFKPDLGE